MRLAAILLVASALGGCGRQAANPAGHAQGRYQGIGIFAPSRTWAQLKGVTAAGSAEGATLADDEAVIVVVDSTTGEVRECGNLSATCLSLQPWMRGVAIAPGAPAALARHAAELEQAGREHMASNTRDGLPAPAARHR